MRPAKRQKTVGESTEEPWIGLPRELRLRILNKRGWSIDMRHHFDIAPGRIKSLPDIRLGKLQQRAWPQMGGLWCAVLTLAGDTHVQRFGYCKSDTYAEQGLHYRPTSGSLEAMFKHVRV